MFIQIKKSDIKPIIEIFKSESYIKRVEESVNSVRIYGEDSYLLLKSGPNQQLVVFLFHLRLDSVRLNLLKEIESIATSLGFNGIEIESVKGSKFISLLQRLEYKPKSGKLLTDHPSHFIKDLEKASEQA
ncbi:hypothetical protein [Desertibacillus haloalkaliphilus]|uniref:hypothetical protein n=1 Tax=Desertibacillus haloalkaliphilus TaxID=1328930 RepID=UPI001C27FFBD|nr:hypothetical protein [Desertibacillus haloalkaliphilus]MBU8908121.1 hypothetical protein [Desertibacillus haloalkaliphilus]